MSDPFSPANRDLIDRIATIGSGLVGVAQNPDGIDGNTTVHIRCVDLDELLTRARNEGPRRVDIAAGAELDAVAEAAYRQTVEHMEFMAKLAFQRRGGETDFDFRERLKRTMAEGSGKR